MGRCGRPGPGPIPRREDDGHLLGRPAPPAHLPIEVLEERDIEEWRQETIREEQQEADERNAQRFGRD